MKRILYASGGFVTDDPTADALMEYAGVLAIVNSADVVSCEGLDDEGNLCELRLVIGPASQILAMSIPDDDVKMNPEFVDELRRRADQHLPNPIDVGEAGTSAARETDAESQTHEPDES